MSLIAFFFEFFFHSFATNYQLKNCKNNCRCCSTVKCNYNSWDNNNEAGQDGREDAIYTKSKVPVSTSWRRAVRISSRKGMKIAWDREKMRRVDVDVGTAMAALAVGDLGIGLPEKRHGESRDVTGQIRRLQTTTRRQQTAVDFAAGRTWRHIRTRLFLGGLYCYLLKIYQFRMLLVLLGNVGSDPLPAVAAQLPPSHWLMIFNSKWRDLKKKISIIQSVSVILKE